MADNDTITNAITPDVSIDVVLNEAELVRDVRQILAVVGKRATTKDGESEFSKVTISTAEDAALKQYVRQGINNAVGELLPKVRIVDENNGEWQISVVHTRWKSIEDSGTFKTSFVNCLKNYVSAFALYEYMSVLQPSLSQKYLNDVQLRHSTLHQMVYWKYEPLASEKDYDDVVCVD